MKIDPLQEFILKDEQNLRIAVSVSDALPEARNRIVTTFLESLKKKLLNELPGWKTDTWETCFEHRYAAYRLFKTDWKYYWIQLQFTDWGQKMKIGVVRDDDSISDRPFCPEVLQAVQKLYPSAKATKWWEAIVLMHEPATDWRAPDVLWKIYTDSSFLNVVADQLLLIAKATESILDRLNKET